MSLFIFKDRSYQLRLTQICVPWSKIGIDEKIKKTNLNMLKYSVDYEWLHEIWK